MMTSKNSILWLAFSIIWKNVLSQTDYIVRIYTATDGASVDLSASLHTDKCLTGECQYLTKCCGSSSATYRMRLIGPGGQETDYYYIDPLNDDDAFTKPNRNYQFFITTPYENIFLYLCTADKGSLHLISQMTFRCS